MVRRCYVFCYRHAEPNIGNFSFHQMIQEDVPTFEVTEVTTSFPFNPRQDLASPETALAFFSGALARYRDELGAAFVDGIAQNAATMAFADAQDGNWQHGLLVLMILEITPDPRGLVSPPRSPRMAARTLAMEDTDHGVEVIDLNDIGDGGGEEAEAEAEEEEEAAPVGLSEHDISMLKKEEIESDAIDESCCVCLEEFTAGAVITPLSPCSHRFHNLCIVKWLRKNGICPICRSICRVD